MSVPILTLPLHVLPADEHEEETFASQDGAGASLTFPQQVSLPPVFFPPRAFVRGTASADEDQQAFGLISGAVIVLEC